MENTDKIKYEQVLKRVRIIKSFHIHLLVFVLINIAYIVVNIAEVGFTQKFMDRNPFGLLYTWGIGLLIHYLCVYSPRYLFSKSWEERKIQEILNKEKSSWQ